jgi:DNA invertase Pin-like site-specific DNA recombinase
MKLIGYVRVSTEEQANSGASLAAQSEKLRQYAALYGHELIEIIEDAGQSAKTQERPGLQRAFALLRSGEAAGLLVAKLDRLTRSVADMDAMIREYFGDRAKYSAALLSVQDQIDTTTAGGRLVLNVLMSVAQWEREAIGERTRDTLRHKRDNGEVYGSTPMGYIREGDRLQESAQGLATIARIKAMRASGSTLRQIAAALNADAVPTQRGGSWHAGTVTYLLKNPLYSEVTA